MRDGMTGRIRAGCARGDPWARKLIIFNKQDYLDALLASLLVSCAILAHELSHLFVGYLLNLPDLRLHYGSFSHAPAPWITPVQRFQVAGAGPLATMVLAAGSIYFWKKSRSRVLFAIAMAACVRIVILLPFGIRALLFRMSGETLPLTWLDEDVAAEALGQFGDLAIIAASGFYLIMLIIALRSASVFAMKGYLVGTVVGLNVWLYLVGPVILPE